MMIRVLIPCEICGFVCLRICFFLLIYASLTPVHVAFQINGFAERYPGLMSLRSVDLSPASWMAVAWYSSLYSLFATYDLGICR